MSNTNPLAHLLQNGNEEAPKTTTFSAPPMPSIPKPTPQVQQKKEEAVQAPLPFSQPNEETKSAPTPQPQVVRAPIPTAPPIPGLKQDKMETNPIPSAPNPFQSMSTTYEIVLPQNATKRQIEIKNSGKKVEELSQEELREVYFCIRGAQGNYILGATTINHIDRTGKHPENDEREESDWLFIGNEIHSAAETAGESLKKLFHFGMIGEEPEKPETFAKLSKDHRDMISEMVLNNKSDVEAYMTVKETLATVKNVKPEWLAEGYVFPCDKEKAELEVAIDQANMGGTDDQVQKLEKALAKVKDSDEKKKVEKLVKAASTEYNKFKSDMAKFKNYFEKLDVYNKRKEDVRKKAKEKEGIVLDDLEFSTMKGSRMYETIAKTYGAFSNNSDAFNIYHPEKISSHKFEIFSEYVILFDWVTSKGKKTLWKSMIDRYIIDHTTKVAWVIDLKTYGKQGNFLRTNYIDHSYWRSMSVYYEAVRVDLERRGLEGYTIKCAILPISMVSLEVGVYGVSLLNLSPQEINLGTNGGFVKFIGSMFNENKEVSYALPQKALEHYMDLGLVNENSPEYRVRGWKKVTEDFFDKLMPVNATQSA